MPSGKISVQNPALKAAVFIVDFEQVYAHWLERHPEFVQIQH